MTSMADVPVYMLPGAPVVQPPYLEGLSDPSLSTEILPGPPSLLSVQQAAHKRDPRKPSAFVSYLPASDPGSTYSGLMAGALGGTDLDGPRRKRARVDKGTANGRAQRASARSLNISNTVHASDPVLPELPPSRQPSMPPVPDSDPFPAQPDSDDPSVSMSRANSLPGAEEPIISTSNGRGRSNRRDKGKGKEADRVFRIKEEPVVTSSLSPEPTFGLLNEDHCSSCRSLGALVYCDSCPRAFHLWCLDPPMEAVDLPEGERWFCPSCIIRKHPPPKPAPSFMSPLIHIAQTSIPKEFQLPDDIRNFFKDVATGANGTYVDSSELKQPRLNRHGQLEDRDPHRLKDRNGVPVICFRCGQSALPTGLGPSAPSSKHPRRSTSVPDGTTSEAWKCIVSCDHCTLHWHLDCVDPPLTSMPSFGKKWMCPNHADQILQSKRRIPKHNVVPIDISKPKQPNNGNIEVIHSQPAAMSEQLVLDEVLINGRRYRVPERVIMLDFWSKISKHQLPEHNEQDVPSTMSSPLTSLSSLDEMEEDTRPISEGPFISRDELRTAQLLCDFRNMLAQRAGPCNRPMQPVAVDRENAKEQERPMVDCGIQTEAELPPPAKVVETKEAPKSHAPKRKAPTRTSARNVSESVPQDLPTDSSTPSQHHAELPSPAKPKRPRVTAKQEQTEESKSETMSLIREFFDMPEAAGRSGRGRRKSKHVESTKEVTQAASSAFVPIAPAPATTSKPPIPHTPAPPAPTVPLLQSSPVKPATPKASVTITQSSASSTPTLKIRLPRLSVVSAAAHSPLAPPVSQSPASHSTAHDTAAANESRPRRSLRRQDSAPVSVSETSSLTADGIDDMDLVKPKHKPPRHGNRKHVE